MDALQAILFLKQMAKNAKYGKTKKNFRFMTDRQLRKNDGADASSEHFLPPRFENTSSLQTKKARSAIISYFGRQKMETWLDVRPRRKYAKISSKSGE